jgi:hypothetical protein
MLVAPFRVFGRVARRGTFPSVGVLSDLAARSEFLTRPGSAVAGSAFPPCRWPFPRLRGFSRAGCAAHS